MDIASKANAALQELNADRISAEADLQKTLSTLRYLHGLQAARDGKANGSLPGKLLSSFPCSSAPYQPLCILTAQ